MNDLDMTRAHALGIFEIDTIARIAHLPAEPLPRYAQTTAYAQTIRMQHYSIAP